MLLLGFDERSLQSLDQGSDIVRLPYSEHLVLIVEAVAAPAFEIHLDALADGYAITSFLEFFRAISLERTGEILGSEVDQDSLRVCVAFALAPDLRRCTVRTCLTLFRPA
ncbi:hypothetical protein CE139_13580 [Pseudomonas oryzihabitans]|uniref:Uncharacterized protein n=1 Tax=Pseudomonas oryzihabitans TaxID=47885 RepID=A0A2Z5A883_9PSED|nr:hypothetical protein CE139_13580 [Pseudomonas oryzihabitans]